MAVINHGTVRGYKLGCRCEECTAANTLAKQRERDRKREREGLPATVKIIGSGRVPTAPKASPLEDGPGPIEEAARAALAEVGGDDALAKLRREVAYRAAAVMDNPKAAPFFKSAAEVMRQTVEDMFAAAPAKDGEGDELAGILASLGRSKRSGPAGRRTPDVHDPAKPGKGDDR